MIILTYFHCHLKLFLLRIEYIILKYFRAIYIVLSMPGVYKYFLMVCMLMIYGGNITQAQEMLWQKTDFSSAYATSVEVTPWGVFAGERDERPLSQSHNGLYFSNNLGVSWQPSSLEKRKITDIYYNHGKIYVTSKDFYQRTVGLFVSSDGGQNWVKTGPNYSSYSIATFENILFLGTGSHGLWISHDSGTTWEQKIGDGIHGPDILEIKTSENGHYAIAPNEVYISKDNGSSWTKIEFLENKNIRHIEINKNVVLAGSASSGMYISTDAGATWEFSQTWGNNPVGDIFYFKGIYYAGKRVSPEQFSIFKSVNGSVWENTQLNLYHTNENVLDLEGLYAASDTLLAVTQNNGIYKYSIPAYINSSEPFLRIPWNEASIRNAIDKITSYFDHNLPLLGYRYHKEPADKNISTTNFIGLEDFAPNLHYSSHDGYDFALPYGTEVLAAANGYATYDYCGDCGNTIKIDHENGYQTIYMHLQNSGLITKSTKPVHVQSGDVIGKVGMTGNTSGPHLHFAVIKDKNSNSTFVDDSPSGRVDPFGWQSYMYKDPWEAYSWTDVLGSHTGSQSKYLWLDPLMYLNSTYNKSAFIEFSNKKITIVPNSTFEHFTVMMGDHGKPTLPVSQKHLIYIPGTSFYIELYNLAGEKIDTLTQNAKIEIDFSSADLSNLIQESIKIYRYSPKVMLWEPTGNFLIDLVEKKVSGETQGFSHFAVFAEKTDSTPPHTEIAVTGNVENGWYTSTPIVNLIATDNINAQNEIVTYYKLGTDPNWYEYIEPFTLPNGIYGIEYKSVDSSGNWEAPKDILFKIDTLNKWKSEVEIKNATFSF